MNKKETIQAVNTLDQCIDSTAQLQVMLMADALRGTILQLWQEELCHSVEGKALLRELDGLPALCTEAAQHPGLPMKLCRVMFILCAPSVQSEMDIGHQCRLQAAHIRRLRQWEQKMSALLGECDEQTCQEIHAMQAESLSVMLEVFAHLLAMYRASIAKSAAEKQNDMLERIESLRRSLPLKKIMDASAQTQTTHDLTKEKFRDFAADISASDLLIKMKGGRHAFPEVPMTAVTLPLRKGILVEP